MARDSYKKMGQALQEQLLSLCYGQYVRMFFIKDAKFKHLLYCKKARV